VSDRKPTFGFYKFEIPGPDLIIIAGVLWFLLPNYQSSYNIFKQVAPGRAKTRNRYKIHDTEFKNFFTSVSS